MTSTDDELRYLRRRLLHAYALLERCYDELDAAEYQPARIDDLLNEVAEMTGR